MRLKVARQVEQQQSSRSSGTDYAHRQDVSWLYTQKTVPWMEFAILPAFPMGVGPGSIDFAAYRDEEGEMTSWVEAYIVYEGFRSEFRNRTASPVNWDENAIDLYAKVASTVYLDKDLRDRLLRSGDLIQEVDEKTGANRGNPKVPWSGRTYNYANVWPTAGPDVELGKVRCLRVASSAMTRARGTAEEGEVVAMWGILDFLDQRDPDDETKFVYSDPTHPDHASIIRLEKAAPPTNSPMRWWKCAFTRHPKLEISDPALAARYDLSTVVNVTSEEESAKHFYEFLTDAPGLIDVMEDLYPQFRPLGRDRIRAAQRSTGAPQEVDELPGLAGRLPAQRTAVGRTPGTGRTATQSAPPAAGDNEAPWSEDTETAAPVAPAATARKPGRAAGARSSVGGAKPLVPQDLRGEVPPTSTASMEASGKTLAEMLGIPDSE